MEKIYGYKQKDLIALAIFLGETDKKVLTEIFSEFAVKSGKSEGTVRNLYYALVKLSKTDVEFTKEYLNGKPLSVNHSKQFTECEEKTLLTKVLTARANGRSARSEILRLSCGNGKLALRLQNKFRSLMSGNSLIKREVIKSLKEKYPYFNAEKKDVKSNFNDFQIKRVSAEINSMIDKLTYELKKENEFYKRQAESLTAENERLNKTLFGDNKRRALDFFVCRNNIKNTTDN